MDQNKSHKFLLVGLDSRSILNPVQVHQLLSKSHDRTENSELEELSLCVTEVPLHGTEFPEVDQYRRFGCVKYLCKCQPLPIDKQRELSLSSRSFEDHRPHNVIEDDWFQGKSDKIDCKPWSKQVRDLDYDSDQAEIFCRINRSYLARKIRRRIGQARRTSCPATLASDSLVMYQLEALICETNSDLKSLLIHESEQSRIVLASIVAGDEFYASTGDDIRLDIMIRAPTSKVQILKPLTSQHRSISGDSGIADDDRQQLASSKDEVIEDSQPSIVYQAIVNCLEFKASRRVRSVVNFSVVYLEGLVMNSGLYHVDELGENAMSSHELKLRACVECQQLRSSIRFEWLTKCLEFAFDDQDQSHNEAHWLPWLVDSDKRALACQDEHWEASRYFDLLALLMSQLLRNHFLVPSLNRWCNLLESLINDNTCHGQIISLEVDLIDVPGETSSGRLEWQLISQKLEQTLGYVMEELVAVCKQIPRLESLLDSTRNCQDMKPKWLDTLSAGDDLLHNCKRRLAVMIHNSQPLNRESPRCYTGQNELELVKIGINWIEPGYHQALELINALRRADMDDEALDRELMNLGGSDAPRNDAGAGKESDSRMHQLAISCKQASLLQGLEFKLACQLVSFIDYGFVQLDLRLARQTLLRCLQKERLLIVRCNVDDLLKLWDRLRLQFDDIELGCDLESAIEDYLINRWQTKQLQIQQQQTGSHGLADQLQRQQVMLAAGDDYVTEEQDEFPLPFCEPLAQDDEAVPIGQQQTEVPRTEEDDEDEFLQAAMSSGNVQQQLMKAPDSTANRHATGDPSLQDQRVAPLIECRLLLERFAYLRQLFDKELNPLFRDLRLAFEGLVLLTELVQADQDHLELNDWETVRELATRSREIGPILRDSLARLLEAKLRLLKLNKLRSLSTSKLVLEFHLLMRVLGQRRLGRRGSVSKKLSSGHTKATLVEQEDELEVADGALNIRQLDSIQEASDWSRKLEARWQFLWSQNHILAKELRLLNSANLKGVELAKVPSLIREDGIFLEDLIQNEDCGEEQRRLILERWRDLASASASLWRLADDYETQQVKWLNSDVKKVNYEHISSSFKCFRHRLDELAASCLAFDQKQEESFVHGLVVNMAEMRHRLNLFESQRLPLFKFLTNTLVGEIHWSKLNQQIQQQHQDEPSKFSLNVEAAQNCTTLAQLIELGFDRYVQQLVAIDRRATVENQLSEFLANEASLNLHLDRSSTRSLNVSDWLAEWTDEELKEAACRFLDMRLASEQSAVRQTTEPPVDLLALQLVNIHSVVKHYLCLRYQLNLDSCHLQSPYVQGRQELKLRSHNLLTSPSQVQPSLFVSYLRMFAQIWLAKRARLEIRLSQHRSSLSSIQIHMADIDQMICKVEQLNQKDVRSCSEQSERILAKLELDTNRLELEREILATREALAMEQQREALRIRDDCIKQISERAIPSIRAATKALDCLSESSFRALRSIRPSPPEPVRMVIEAVCLLRHCTINNKPHNLAERHFDALTGHMVQDYWPMAKRMINSCHSSQFVTDLRRADKKSIPNEIMRLIRRKYLSSSEFQPRQIERVSQEAAHLARWLIAVDVFDRVINVVRPNYARYLEAEARLTELLCELGERRRHIEMIGAEISRIEDSFERKVALEGSLANLLAQCRDKLVQVRVTRVELERRHDVTSQELARLNSKQQSLANKCLLAVAQIVYIETIRREDQHSLCQLIKSAVFNTMRA